MMLWVILVLVSAFVYSLVNIIDKIAISKEFRDPIFATFIYGLVSFVAFGAIGFFIDVVVPLNFLIISFLIGAFACISVYSYYSILEEAEVSSLTPLLSTFPVFVVILAYFFLGEVLSLVNYLGIGLLIFGVFLVSANDHKFKIGWNRTFILTMGIVILVAIGQILVKYLTLNISVLQVLFWGGIGAGVVSLPLYIFHHPHLKKKAKKGMGHLILSNVLTAFAAALIFFAISLGPVSLVSALSRMKLLFVFAEAYLLSVFVPKILKERIGKRVVMGKLCAIVLIIVGAVLTI